MSAIRRGPTGVPVSARSQEQAAFASRGHLAIIEELTGQTVDSIVFTGGAAKGQLWPRIVADVLGVTVHVPEVKESTALGAAMLAGVGVGLHPDLDTVARAIARFERTIEPDPAATAAMTTPSRAGPRSTRGCWRSPRTGSRPPCGGRPAHEPPDHEQISTTREHTMPEADSLEGKQFHADIPARNSAFHLKGAGAYDWGMQSRLNRVFSPPSGRTVMLAIDHGYFQGPTTGLERVDLDIVPLLPEVDALFCTRGMLRSSVPAGIRCARVPAWLAAARRSSRSCRTRSSPSTSRTRCA